MRGGAADLRSAPVTQAVASESIQRLDLSHRQWAVEYQQLIQQAPLCRRRGPADVQYAGRAAGVRKTCIYEAGLMPRPPIERELDRLEPPVDHQKMPLPGLPAQRTARYDADEFVAGAGVCIDRSPVPRRPHAGQRHRPAMIADIKEQEPGRRLGMPPMIGADP